MNNILLLIGGSRGAKSYSQQVAYDVVEELKSRWPGAILKVRDLAKDPLPHVGDAFASGRLLPPEKRSPAEAEALAVSDAMVDELEAADVVVLAVPMHNFGLPSALKAWIDHVVRPGRTFSYSAAGPQGLLKGKQVIVVASSGGVYSQGPMKQFDFQEPYLRSVLGFIGITDVRVVRVEGVALGDEAIKRAIASAKVQSEEIVREIA
jgi:FMN-dependent NADH-azoreductase